MSDESQAPETDAPAEGRRRTLRGADPELLAMAECQRTLEDLDDLNAAFRVIDWLSRKFETRQMDRVRLFGKPDNEE
jgi:hypothetical protein